jgi:DnaD/phage-associated family protein
MPFTGFTSDTLYTPVPNPIFGPVLEQIEDLAELKVTLRGLWLLHRKKALPRAVPLEEFLGDRSLLRGLAILGKNPADEVRRGLKLAVGRGTFLVHGEDGPSQLFLLNAEAGRRALARMKQSGEQVPVNIPGKAVESDLPPPIQERPNIFVLYEDNIGTLSPILADQLKEAEERYPWNWIKEAFEIAVVQNKRSWRYIVGILRRWGAEGKDEGKDNGKPGRHTPKDQRQEYIEDYERRRGRYTGNRAGS